MLLPGLLSHFNEYWEVSIYEWKQMNNQGPTKRELYSCCHWSIYCQNTVIAVLAQVTQLHVTFIFHCRKCGTDIEQRKPVYMSWSSGDHDIHLPCRVFGSSSLEWRSPLITQTTSYLVSATPPMILNRGPFTVSLISVSGTPLNANFTSTLAINISAGECEFHLWGRCTMTLTKIHTVDIAHYQILSMHSLLPYMVFSVYSHVQFGWP